MSLLSKVKQKASKLKSEALALTIAYADKRTPISVKILIGITVGYLFCPIDLIPDFIPVLGLLDDLIIVPILISLSIRLLPEIVLRDSREIAQNNPQYFKKKNWLFAFIIVLIWIISIYSTYRILKSD